MLLRSGDAWTVEGDDPAITLSRQAERWGGMASPWIIASYGSHPKRPRTEAAQLLRLGSPKIEGLILVGLEVHHAESDPAHPRYAKRDGGRLISLTGGGRWIHIEDCVFRFGQLSFNGFDGGILRDLVLRRNIIVDAYENGSGTKGSSAKISGVYATNCAGLSCEENLFDHNGWNARIEGAEGNIFNHNLYIQSDNTEVTAIGNIFARAGSHGTQFRSGGTLVGNLFVHNPAAAFIGENPAWKSRDRIEHNVVLHGQPMETAAAKNRGQNRIVWGLEIAAREATTLENIVAHQAGQGVVKNIWCTDVEEPAGYATNICHAWSGSFANARSGFPDPGRDLASYCTAVLKSDVPGWYSRLRARPPRTWERAASAYGVIDYIRAGFGLPSCALGTWATSSAPAGTKPKRGGK